MQMGGSRVLIPPLHSFKSGTCYSKKVSSRDFLMPVSVKSSLDLGRATRVAQPDVKKSFVYEDSRLSLCGDSFAISSFAIMGAQMCVSMVPRMSPRMIQQRLGLAPGSSAHPSLLVPMSRFWPMEEEKDTTDPWRSWSGNLGSQLITRDQMSG